MMPLSDDQNNGNLGKTHSNVQMVNNPYLGIKPRENIGF
jgi:hypothetical protein